MRRPEYNSTAPPQPITEALIKEMVSRARVGDRVALHFLKGCARNGNCTAFDALVECTQASERVALAVEHALNGNEAALHFLLGRAQIGDRTAFAFLGGRLREGNRLVLSFLVAQAQKRDQAAFTFLYQNFVSPLGWYLTNLIGDKDLASEFTQEAFVQAWIELPGTSDETKEKFRAWLYRIATNLAMDHFRRSRASLQSLEQLEESGTLDIPSMEGPENLLSVAELVQQALKKVRPRHRKAILMEAFQNSSQREKAQQLGVTENTFSGFVSRGRQELKEAYNRLLREAETLEEEGPIA